MTMFHQFDVVTIEKALPGVAVQAGAEGTIIRIFHWMNPVVYDVSFHDADGRSLGAFHVMGDEALALKRSLWQELKDRK